jgi:hypothetical protein
LRQTGASKLRRHGLDAGGSFFLDEELWQVRSLRAAVTGTLVQLLGLYVRLRNLRIASM